MTKITVAFRNLANAPKNVKLNLQHAMKAIPTPICAIMLREIALLAAKGETSTIIEYITTITITTLMYAYNGIQDQATY
jgi:hypothetical protein